MHQNWRLARARSWLRFGMHYRYHTWASLYERCVRVCVCESCFVECVCIVCLLMWGVVCVCVFVTVSCVYMLCGMYLCMSVSLWYELRRQGGGGAMCVCVCVCVCVWCVCLYGVVNVLVCVWRLVRHSVIWNCNFLHAKLYREHGQISKYRWTSQL